MNYRHAYHAGNFADVLKHATLALVIERLAQKDTPFRVIDTHAGIGLYDLDGAEAQKTGEWRHGIGRLMGIAAEPIDPEPERLLEPYLAVVRAVNPKNRIERYPGSPTIARALMRPQDRLVANELHPEDGARLAALFAADRQTKILRIDGWTALKSLLPPKERRGIILVDPPYEAPNELDRLAIGLRGAVRRFATGIYLLWYPIKDPKPIAGLHRALAEIACKRLLVAELLVRLPRESENLNGCGLAILNPPYRLEEALAALLPFLADRLGEAGQGQHRLVWLVGAPA